MSAANTKTDHGVVKPDAAKMVESLLVGTMQLQADEWVTAAELATPYPTPEEIVDDAIAGTHRPAPEPMPVCDVCGGGRVIGPDRDGNFDPCPWCERAEDQR